MWMLSACGTCLGAIVFGQRTLLILATRELVPTSAGGKADAIVNVLGEFGGVLAGYPLIALVESAGWNADTSTLTMCALLLVAFNARLLATELKTHRQKPQQQQQQQQHEQQHLKSD
jgi:sugar phosphate permease